MKQLKLLLVFVLLSKTIDAEKNDENEINVSFKVETIWKSYRNKDNCPRKGDTWKEGVQELHDGCRTSTRKFRGKAYDAGDMAVDSLREYMTKLIYFTNCNSTIVAPSSTAMLTTLSKCNYLTGSSMDLIIKFTKAYPIIVKEFNEIAETLWDHIGEMTSSFTNAASDLGAALSKFMTDFVQSCRFFNCRKAADFKPVLEMLRALMNTVARIDQTLLTECENDATQDVYDSVLVLHLLYYEFNIGVEGIHSCFLDVLYDHDLPVSENLESCSFPFKCAFVEIIQAISAVVLPCNDSITDLMKIFVNTTTTLNTAVKPFL